MRIAAVSDIHGNLTAFEAVLADIRQQSPDLVLHGGDLADCGSSPIEIIDRLRHLGWQGHLGGRGVVDTPGGLLAPPESLAELGSQSSAPPSLWETVRQIAAA